MTVAALAQHTGERFDAIVRSRERTVQGLAERRARLADVLRVSDDLFLREINVFTFNPGVVTLTADLSGAYVENLLIQDGSQLVLAETPFYAESGS